MNIQRYIIRIIPVIILGIFIESCGSKSIEKLIIVKWEYDHMQQPNGKPVDLNDSMSSVPHERNKGVNLVFNSNNTYEAKKKESGIEKVFAKGSYGLSDDKAFIITKQEDGTTDRLQII